MNEPQAMQLQLNSEELALLQEHLTRHLDHVDRELVRTDNPTLQHHIAHEARVLEAVVSRLRALRS